MSQSRVPPQELYKYPNSPEEITERAKQCIERYHDGVKNLLAAVEPSAATFDNFMLPLAHLENERLCDEMPIATIMRCHPDKKFRDAADTSIEMLDSQIRRPRVSQHARAIIAKSEVLDDESQKFLKNEESFGETHRLETERSKEINDRIVQIELQFDKNVTLNIGRGRTRLSEAEVKKIKNPGLISYLEQDDEGYFVTHDSRGFHRLDCLCENPEVRKRAWMESQEYDCNGNNSLVKELVLLRHEQALILGFANFATYMKRNHMITDPKAVQRFLTRFQGRVARANHMEDLKAEKRNDPTVVDKTFQFWDRWYYRDKLRERRSYSDCDDEKTKVYFPYQSTLRGMLDIYGNILGIVIEKMDVKLWHEDMELYTIWSDENSGGGFCGYLCMDLFSRPGKISGQGGYNFPDQPGYTSRSGERRYPTNILVCGFQRPMPPKPNLLGYQDVSTIFHELGHGIHACLSRNRYGRHGQHSLRDFMEMPCKLFENWMFVPEVLKKLSTHYETGEKMPDEMIQSMIKFRPDWERTVNVDEVITAKFDLEVHSLASLKVAEDMDLSEIFCDLQSKICGIPYPENCPRSRSYACNTAWATIYTGTYSDVAVSLCIADLVWKDLFEKNPMSKEAGMRFRREVLEKGGSMAPMDMLERLLGKKIDIEELGN